MKKQVGRPPLNPKDAVSIRFDREDVDRLGRDKIREICINAVKNEKG